MSSSTPLQLYRGSLNDINSKLTEIEDGRLIFAVDTKQIYLDYDVDNGLYDEPTRIKFGGSTVILLVKKDIIKIDSNISLNSNKKIETSVKYGEVIGKKLK